MKRAWMGWCVLMMTGCAAPPVAQAPDQLKATHGFVYVELPKDPPSNTLQLRALSGGATFSLARSDLAPKGFGAWVPAGDYEVPSMVRDSKGSYTPIRVTAGRMTDLGGIVSFDVGGNMRVLLPFRHPEFEAHRQLALDKNRAHLSSPEPIEWTPSAPPKPYDVGTPGTGLGLIADLLMTYNTHVNKPTVSQQLKSAATIPEFLAITKTIQPPATAPAADAAGNHYYGADLGQVRVRDPQGTWQALDTGTVATITAVAVDDRRLIAGTNEGTLRISDDLGKTWKSGGMITGGEAVVDIDAVSAQVLIVSTRTVSGAANAAMVDQIQVNSVNRADFSDPRLLRRITLKEPVHSLLASGIRAQVLGDFYFVNAFEELARYDLAAKTWKNVYPGHAVALFDAEPRTGLLSTFRNQGVFSKLSTSSDNGDSWQTRETPPYGVERLHMRATDAGDATRWNPGAFTVTMETYRLKPGAPKWEKTGETPPTACPRTVHDVAYTQVFCVTSSNSILKLTDGGKLAVEFAAN